MERKDKAAGMTWKIRSKLGFFTFLTVCLDDTLHFFLKIFLFYSYPKHFRLEIQGKYIYREFLL